MDIGMLWYDDDTKRPLGEKVARAVDYYKTKYGSVPTVCFVNPVTLNDAPDAAAGGSPSSLLVAGVHIRSARNVMVDHFWIGVGESNGNGHGRGNGNGNGNGARSPNGHAAARPNGANGSRNTRTPARSDPGRAG
jgi:hypothetical protein